MASFAEWVCSNRSRREWSRQVLAIEAGVSLRRIRDIEKESWVIPHESTLAKFATIFGIEYNVAEYEIGIQHDGLSLGQHEILDGLMLGDGHLKLPKAGVNAALCVNRAARDIGYNQWLSDQFSNFVSFKSLRCGTQTNPITHVEIPYCQFRTNAARAFTKAYQRWYPNHQKQIPSDLQLSQLAIAVWIADDGSFRQTGPKGVLLKFYTNGFTKNETYILADLLRKRYIKNFHVYTIAGKYPIIQASTPAALAVLEDVDSVFPLNRKAQLWRPLSQFYKCVSPKCFLCQSTNTSFCGWNKSGTRKCICKDCKHRFTIHEWRKQ